MRMRSLGLVLLALTVSHGAPAATEEAPAEPDLDALARRIEAAKAEAAKRELADKAAVEQRKSEQARTAESAQRPTPQPQGTLVVQSDSACALSIDGQKRAVLQAGTPQTLAVIPGEQLIRCVSTASPEVAIEQVKTVVAGSKQVVQLAMAAQLKPTAGRVFHDALKDGSAGPELVVLPAGSFTMGSAISEADRSAIEGPQHMVTLKAFALGRYEVTVAQFRQFAEVSGYRSDAEKNVPLGITVAEGCFTPKGGTAFGFVAGTSWKQPGFAQSDDSPAVCLSFNDALAYVDWLSAQTGKHYRLPSEAEQEYAIRAGSQSRFPWGTDADQACRHANVGDSSFKTKFPTYPTASCDDGSVFTTAVGRYSANAFGLFDTIGNAFEWSGDCFHDKYEGAPSDGSSWSAEGCDSRVFRGAGWGVSPARFRAASRSMSPPSNRGSSSGVRVAQDL